MRCVLLSLTFTQYRMITIDNHTLSNHIYANRQERTATPIIITGSDGARGILVASNGGVVSRYSYDAATAWVGASEWRATDTISRSFQYSVFTSHHL